MVRKTRTVSMIGGDTSKRSWLQNSGIVKVQSWLPVWQYHPDDKTSSVWVYTSNTAGWPTQKLTWGGVTSLEQGQRQLAQQTVRKCCARSMYLTVQACSAAPIPCNKM